jgi:hypothetical protein
VVVAGTRFAVSMAHFFARSARVCVTTRVGEVWMVEEGRMVRDVELWGMRRRRRCRVPVFGCLWPFSQVFGSQMGDADAGATCHRYWMEG